jgi:hypothetical protein
MLLLHHCRGDRLRRTLTERDGIAYDLAPSAKCATADRRLDRPQVINEAATRTSISFNRTRRSPGRRPQLHARLLHLRRRRRKPLRGRHRLQPRAADLQSERELSQEAVANDDGDDTLVSGSRSPTIRRSTRCRASASTSASAGPTTSWRAATPTTRVNLGVNYRRRTDADWDWVVGYEARLEDGGDTATATGSSPSSTEASRSVPEPPGYRRYGGRRDPDAGRDSARPGTGCRRPDPVTLGVLLVCARSN